jgi:predicted transcriptional regulator
MKTPDRCSTVEQQLALACFIFRFLSRPQEERHRLTLEGMADVTAGRVVDQADVEAWAASLATGSPLPVPQQ